MSSLWMRLAPWSLLSSVAPYAVSSAIAFIIMSLCALSTLPISGKSIAMRRYVFVNDRISLLSILPVPSMPKTFPAPSLIG